MQAQRNMMSALLHYLFSHITFHSLWDTFADWVLFSTSYEPSPPIPCPDEYSIAPRARGRRLTRSPWLLYTAVPGSDVESIDEMEPLPSPVRQYEKYRLRQVDIESPDDGDQFFSWG